MVEMFAEYAGGIPVLHAVPAGQRDAVLPTVFFHHGFLSSKEMYSYFGYVLAERGLRVILPEADMHGERFNGDESYRLTHFWDILRRNVDELPQLVEHYRSRGLIAPGRLGVAGVSLGGMTTLAAKARYDWIDAAAALMGSGYFLSLAHTLFPPFRPESEEEKRRFAQDIAPLAQYEIGHQLEKVADRPLFLWHGLADDLVPAAESARLMAELGARGLLEKVVYRTEAGIAHKITVNAQVECCRFFEEYL
ncbi:esterase [Enterobacillus tribolii]|uniref:Peptidase S9 prolyl oligopeptidase catalytic domain-containing protein n=1 Tax=Enterobacillus tribolii TaxID=1487935 RepID=A0A370R129_9GAMM|nr:esterase [Enterobacillus tribolii]MBW7982821.1 esterase [Enterobacillus tribolii]RDK95618.1 hypothetical protein C8D90_10293 [Enterobacillus tribolii]